MIAGKSVLAIIPARGGSKGVPRKNIRNVGGKPLIAWTIEEAKKSKYIDRLILSSEDDEIISVAKLYGCEVPYKRPTEWAQDDTPGIKPVIHAIETLPEKYDYVILLQPTSPLRKAEDIDSSIALCNKESAKACVTVTEPDKSPFWMYTLDSKNKISPMLPLDGNITIRQDLPKVYALNGAVYVSQTQWLLEKESFLTEETIAYPMVKERSLDIDTEFDLELVQIIMEKNLK